MKKAIPPRLHGLLARDSTAALLIRRGPTRYACTIGWDRATDRFRVGQWLHGRIYERRSDLSPDGKHFLYFAHNGRKNSETGGSWTALSSAPYLKAIGLWGKGDCWHGGGLFLSAHEYWINDGYGHKTLRMPEQLQPMRVAQAQSLFYGEYGGECLHVYYNRLQRDGWELKARQRDAAKLPTTITLFEKGFNKHWVLVKEAYATSAPRPMGKGCYYDEHYLLNRKTGAQIACAAWEWADVDVGRERLVWASNGKIFAGKPAADGAIEATELFDATPMRFEPLVAP